MSLSINEAELPALMRSNVAGNFVAWNYLHAFDTPENRAFIAEWRRFIGRPDAMTNDPMEATWIGFHLWAAAVEAAGTTDVAKVREALGGKRIAAPSGFTVQMDGQDPSPLQAGDDRPHHRRRPHRAGLGHRRPGAARSVEPVAGPESGSNACARRPDNRAAAPALIRINAAATNRPDKASTSALERL